MIYYTIVPQEMLFANENKTKQHRFVLENGAYKEYEYGKNGEKKLKNLFSTEPNDYLKYL